ncbi:MerC mercury resistance protein [Stieleria maiorica]|uniref:MerC mercury resistance protein n=1 Tax=Stieleria maiorica TaxID=2795974 RepID=A0A5B9MDC3_9BACT|nr:MerC domain-containing protein [Stieleria maiorica]QEF99252.1 MerC mercury resistance protein [Stieleria maiorica]
MSRELCVIDVVSAGPTGQPARSAWIGWSDWAGMVASIGCAIHCAAMPFVIAYLPALGLSFLADEAFHQWMAVGCFIIALTAFVPGFRKHGRLKPVIIGSVGLVLISVAAFGFAGECCASCESEVVSAPMDATSVSGDLALATSTEVCTDACCPFCAADDHAAHPDPVLAGLNPSTPPTLPAWVGRLMPWITPLGGFVLVLAHLLNQHYGCLCGCCEKTAASHE